MLTLLERCFPAEIDGWRPLLQEAIPSYGHKLSEEPELLAEVFADTTRTLELHS
jgi:malate dehydrogenase (quinone)